MDAERAHLINTIFPYLRGLARERRVEFTEVDLRWGITDPEAQSGNVIRICLTEIDECRKKSDELPFFIGLLGGRYGWIPTKEDVAGDSRLRLEFPDIDDYLARKLSVTEMEMRHAVLDTIAVVPGIVEQSYFFLRDPACTEELRNVGKPDTIFIDSDDTSLSTSEILHAEIKLDGLRSEIRSVMGPRKSLNYSTAIDLGEKVIAAFTSYLNEFFPAEQKKDVFVDDATAIDIARLVHERENQVLFAQARMEVYIGRGDYYETIDLAVNSKRQLVLTGSTGSGKTALLANWIARWQSKSASTNSPVPVLYHFCGGTADSDCRDTMLRRLIAELYLFSNQEIKLPARSDELPMAFIDAITEIPSEKQIILVLDGLDQLDNHSSLNWLPPNFPDHISMVISIKSPVDGVRHELLGILEERGFETLPVEPLNASEIEAIITKTLRVYGKKIDSTIIQMISQFKGSSNPLILKTLIEEMRLIGNHHTLKTHIESYIKYDSPEVFFEKVLTRIEDSFNGAGEVMGLLCASRMGLTENEILALMNVGDPKFKRFNVIAWAGLHEVIRPHTKEQDGRITWFHDMVRSAAKGRYYLKENIPVYHSKLAEYFEGYVNINLNRSCEELPYHLNLLNQIDRLKQFIVNIDVLLHMLGHLKNDLISYFVPISKTFDVKSELELSFNTYIRGTRFSFEEVYDYAHSIGTWLTSIGENTAAEYFIGTALTSAVKFAGMRSPERASCLTALAQIGMLNGKYTEAKSKLIQSLQIYEEMESSYHSYAVCLDKIAQVCQATGSYEEAYNYYLKECIIARSYLHKEDLAMALNNIAVLCFEIDDFENAEKHLHEAYEIRLQINGDKHIETANVMANLAILFNKKGDRVKAYDFLKKSLTIKEKLYGPEHRWLWKTLRNLGEILSHKGDYLKAQRYLTRALEIARKHQGNLSIDTADCLVSLARVTTHFSLQDAACMFDEAAGIMERFLDNKSNDNIRIRGILSEYYYSVGDFNKSKAFLLKLIELGRGRFGPYHKNLTLWRVSYATCLDANKELEASECAFQDICSDYRQELITIDDDYAYCLTKLGEIAAKKNDFLNVIRYYREAFRLRAQLLGERDLKTLRSMSALGAYLLHTGDFTEAEELLSKNLSVLQTLPGINNRIIGQAYYNLGILFKKTDRSSKSNLYIENAKKLGFNP